MAGQNLCVVLNDASIFFPVRVVQNSELLAASLTRCNFERLCRHRPLPFSSLFQSSASAVSVLINHFNHGTQSMNQTLPLHRQANRDCQTLNAKNAGALDKDLMSIGAFSLDQLMELAGLSVSQAGS